MLFSLLHVQVMLLLTSMKFYEKNTHNRRLNMYACIWNIYAYICAYYTSVLSWGRTYLFPRHGSLVCWSQRGPVHPPSHSQEKPDWLVAWHVPCTQTFLWQGSQPGRIPTCSGTFLKSWSSLLIYRLRMQPWKLVPFCPGDWRKAAMLFFTGMPRKLIIANNRCNTLTIFYTIFSIFKTLSKECFFLINYS